MTGLHLSDATDPAAPDVHARAPELGRLMLDLVADKLGEPAAAAWADALLNPTRAGTVARKESDKANSQLVRNVLAVAGVAA